MLAIALAAFLTFSFIQFNAISSNSNHVNNFITNQPRASVDATPPTTKASFMPTYENMTLPAP
nr:hypothetical protein [Candidatus Sigynarchaeota archaeon]